MPEPTERAHPAESPPVPGPVPVAAPAQPPALDPLLGLTEFAVLAGLSVTRQAGLRRWMMLRGDDPHGHYPRADWDGYLHQMQQHRPEV
jgi:hypothetical protein